MLSQVRVRCATTPCATLFFPQLPAVVAPAPAILAIELLVVMLARAAASAIPAIVPNLSMLTNAAASAILAFALHPSVIAKTAAPTILTSC